MTTPPPPGQSPYGPPPQAGYGYPQQPPQPGAVPPQGGFGQAPGGYPPPGPGYPQGGFPPPAAPKRGMSRLAIRLIVLGVVIVVGIVVAVLNHNDAESVKAGDCMQNTGTDDNPDMKQRDCSDSRATYVVLKKISGSTDTTKCDNVPGDKAAYYETENGSSFMLCLGDNK
jgi:hypothetical protein